jgi:non-specific serine/threonine protein kinase
LTSFVGRERELEEVRRLAAGARLITLTGSGGVGKTRLALEAAISLISAYADGVWLVDLASLVDPGLVARTLAATFGLSEVPGHPLLGTIDAFLETRQTLVVLDNCEHLHEACSELAEHVLRACPRVCILATSRQRLGAVGEVSWRVPSLSIPDSTSSEAAASEAVRLFVERSRLARPEFALDDKNAPAVSQICRRLDGIPLAIELAAARVRVLSPEQILTRLDDGFHLLVASSRSVPSRHHTLLATLDWSYSLLSPAERVLFGRLSVFAAGFTLEAAESVASGGVIDRRDVLDLLSGLIDKSLVTLEAGASDSARYGLLQVVRQYGAQRLIECGECESVRQKHVAYFVQVADLAEQHMLAALAHTSWINRLEREHDNFRMALEWSIHKQDFESGVRLAAGLFTLWYMRGYLAEGRRWLDSLFALPGAAPSPAHAKSLRGAGLLAFGEGDYDAARVLTERAVDMAVALDDKRLIFAAQNNLGIILIDQGEYAVAQFVLEQALASARQLGHEPYIAVVLNNLGVVALGQGQYTTAERWLEDSLAITRPQGLRLGMAWAIGNLGIAAFFQGDLATARSRLTESMALAREVGDKRIMAERFEELGWVASLVREFDRAATLFGAADTLRAAIGAPMPPAYRATYDRAVSLTRAALGEALFASRWQTGRSLSLQRAVSFALGEDESRRGPVTEPKSPLTAREREVAALVARGLSNREIADTLVVSVRTAEVHVTNILAKLGLRSRAQLAVWALEHGLHP